MIPRPRKTTTNTTTATASVGGGGGGGGGASAAPSSSSSSSMDFTAAIETTTTTTTCPTSTKKKKKKWSSILKSPYHTNTNSIMMTSSFFFVFIIYLRIFSSPPSSFSLLSLSSPEQQQQQQRGGGDFVNRSRSNSSNNHDRLVTSPPPSSSSSSISSLTAIEEAGDSNSITTTPSLTKTATHSQEAEASTSDNPTKEEEEEEEDDDDDSSKQSKIIFPNAVETGTTSTTSQQSTLLPPNLAAQLPETTTTMSKSSTNSTTAPLLAAETSSNITTNHVYYKSPLELAEAEAAAAGIKKALQKQQPAPPPAVSSLLPWSNLTTLAYSRRMFYSGYRNQMQAFTVVVLYAIENGYGQIIVNSLQMKDTYGSNMNIPFQNLWDVEHWNSFYPQLPRLVIEDFKLHPNYDDNTRSKYISWMMDMTLTTTTDQTNHQTSTTTITDTDATVGANVSFVGAGATMPESNSSGTAIPIPDSPIFLHVPQHKLMPKYRQYSKGKGPYRLHNGKVGKGGRGSFGEPHPADLLMQKVALRPNPELQKILDGVVRQMYETAEQKSLLTAAETSTKTRPQGTESGRIINDKNDNNRYMTVHARVEPDMQQHPVCRDVKVLNLTDIVDFVEQGLISGQLRPVPKFIFMPLNRKLLERESRRHPENTIAKGNLRALDDVLRNGLLNGTVPVIHGYNREVLRGTSFENRPSTTQSALSYQIAIDAEIFVGTRVSSYSHALVTSRFYRDRHNLPNFEYLPHGLQDWTPPELERPPPFLC